MVEPVVEPVVSSGSVWLPRAPWPWPPPAGRILDADHAEVLVQVHGHVGSVGLRDVGFVLGVAIGVGLGPQESGAATGFGERGGLDLGERVAGQRGLVAALTAVAAPAAGASIFHADHVEGLVQVDGGLRAVGFHHVHFVLGVAVRVGLGSDHRGVASHLRQRGGRGLAEGVAGQQASRRCAACPRVRPSRRCSSLGRRVRQVAVPVGPWCRSRVQGIGGGEGRGADGEGEDQRCRRYQPSAFQFLHGRSPLLDCGRIGYQMDPSPRIRCGRVRVRIRFRNLLSGPRS